MGQKDRKFVQWAVAQQFTSPLLGDLKSVQRPEPETLDHLALVGAQQILRQSNQCLEDMSIAESACGYAAVILHEDGIAITVTFLFFFFNTYFCVSFAVNVLFIYFVAEFGSTFQCLRPAILKWVRP